MLVLLSFALVLVATVLLVLGLMSDDGLLLIYLSIGSSVVAAIVLLVALRLNRKQSGDASERPAPLPEAEPALVGATADSAGEGDATVTPAPSSEEADGAEWQAGDQDDFAATDATAPSAAAASSDEDDEAWDGEVEFPIADYDTLTTAQILPLLPQLYVDEIDVVEARERDTKGRSEILSRLDQLRETGTDVDPADPGGELDEPGFPIEDYEALSAAQIRPLLSELDSDELAMVRDREMSLGRRQSLIDDIDARLDVRRARASESSAGASVPTVADVSMAEVGAVGGSPAEQAAAVQAEGASDPVVSEAGRRAAGAKAPEVGSAAAPVTADAAKSPAKKTAAKKAPAKKATATSKAAPAKKAAAKKAPAKKTTTTAKKATAKKAPAKKAPAKKPAKKTAAKKATATSKATPAKKAAAKKAPAKKATATAKKAPAKKAAAKKAPAKKTTAKKAARKSTEG